MNFEGNAARELPTVGDNAPKKEKTVPENIIPGTEAYYEYLGVWDPDQLTPEDREKWELLKKTKKISDVQRARLAGLRKMQSNFGVGEGFAKDELEEFLLLSKLEEEENKRLNQKL